MNKYQDTTERQYLHAHQARTTGPAGQILVTAMIVWALVGACAINWGWLDGWFITFVSGVLAAGAHWIYLQRIWLTKVMEVVTGRDFDGDGVIGPVEPVTVNRTLKVEIQHKTAGGNLTGADYLPDLDETVMVKIAAALASGIAFSVNDMVEKNKIITRAEYDDIAPKLREAGLMEWKNAKFEKLGMRPTEEGNATFDALTR
jgi:hypothetical protein